MDLLSPIVIFNQIHVVEKKIVSTAEETLRGKGRAIQYTVPMLYVPFCGKLEHYHLLYILT